MKELTIYSLFVLIVLASGFTASAQVEFIEVTTFEEMEKAREAAKNDSLLLFVDVYATWCGPCKVMDREVYTDPEVAGYMNEKFVSVRMDGETEYGNEYAKNQQLKGYPSMFIFGPGGERISQIMGFTPADQLIASLENTVDNYGIVSRLQEKHEEGDLDSEEFADYIAAQRLLGNQEEAERLAAEYRERIMGSKLTDEDIRVVGFYLDLGDSWWPEFSDDEERLREVLGDDYMLALEKIYNNTLIKAVETENIELISKMANELGPMIKEEETQTWDLRSLPFIQYYYYTDQLDELTTYVDQRFATDRKDDHRWLYGAASKIVDMDQQYRTEALLEKGAEWFRTCIEIEEQFDYYFYYGMVLYFLEEKEQAKESFLKAESLASNNEENEMIRQVLDFVDMR